jgi:methylglyoxal synthase
VAGPDGELSPRPFRLALVAHDAKKAEMADFVAAHREAMRGFELTATGTTGARIIERCPDLFVARVKSGPLGGDQQIGALIAEGRIDALIFFVDPLSPHPHDVDVKALTRLGLVYDIPMALNRATAERIMRAIGDALPSHDVVLGRAEDESRGSHGR